MMADSLEPSSSLSFTSSSYTNGSLSYNMSISSEPVPSLEVISLNKLSSNLAQLLIDDGFDYTDADIIVEGVPIGIHRCILAARSRFMHNLFRKNEKPSMKDGKPQYHMNELLPYGKVGYDAFLIFLSYLYTGKLQPSPANVSTCVDSSCDHDACRPAIDFAVQLTYASSIFQIPELVSLFQVSSFECLNYICWDMELILFIVRFGRHI